MRIALKWWMPFIPTLPILVFSSILAGLAGRSSAAVLADNNSILVTFSGVTTEIRDSSLPIGAYPLGAGTFSGSILFNLGGIQTIYNANMTGYHSPDTVATFTIDSYTPSGTEMGNSTQSTLFLNNSGSPDQLVSQTAVGNFVFGFVVQFKDGSFGPLKPHDPSVLLGLDFEDIVYTEVSFLRSGTSLANFGRLTDVKIIPELGTTAVLSAALALFPRRRRRL